jgi:hypothetical protein
MRRSRSTVLEGNERVVGTELKKRRSDWSLKL